MEGQLCASRCILAHVIKRLRRGSVLSKPKFGNVVITFSLHDLALVRSLRRAKGSFSRRGVGERENPRPH
jgi:hypothetical protein